MLKFSGIRKFFSKKVTEKLPSKVLDFNLIINEVEVLNPKAQTTLMWRLINVLPLDVVETTKRYATKRLQNDKSNINGSKGSSAGGNSNY